MFIDAVTLFSQEADVPVFDNDDVAYVAWLYANPGGYVLNTYRKPHPDYLILHRAACKSISRTAEPPVRWTTSDFVKVCAESVAEIDAWCRENAGGAPQPCGQCHPLSSA
jgi:hypothetical protein